MANIGQRGQHRDWLLFDGTSQTMFWALCRKHASDGNRSNSCASGTQNLKSHLHVMKIAKGISAPETRTAMRTLVGLKTAQLDRMALLFRNAHAIAKKGRPFQDLLSSAHLFGKQLLSVSLLKTDIKCVC